MNAVVAAMSFATGRGKGGGLEGSSSAAGKGKKRGREGLCFTALLLALMRERERG